jgi:hypothetical protein
MTQATIWMWFLIITGFMMTFVCYWLVAEALFPAMVRQSREQYSRPVVVTLYGLLVTVPLIVLGIFLLNTNNPAVKAVGFVLLCITVAVGLVGSSGLAQRVGLGLPSNLDETQPWRRVLRGGIVLVFVFLLPLAGWFVLLPWTLISGVGAITRACSQARNSATPSAAAPIMVESKPVAG